MLGGAQSSPLHALSGVPQGSVLGPLLFLVYIDGVSGTVPNSNIAMYADDIALYKLIRNPRDYTLFQNNITSLCNWVSDNDLVLNLGKCTLSFQGNIHQLSHHQNYALETVTPLPDVMATNI